MYKAEFFGLLFWQTVITIVECVVIGFPWWTGLLITAVFLIPVIGLIGSLISSHPFHLGDCLGLAALGPLESHH